VTLAEQVRQLIAHARHEAPDWHGEWNIRVRPETFALLSKDLRPGVILDPEDITRGLATEAIDGCEVRTVDLLWDVVMAYPGIGDSHKEPPTYYLDLTTEQIHTWTEDSADELGAKYGHEEEEE